MQRNCLYLDGAEDQSLTSGSLSRPVRSAMYRIAPGASVLLRTSGNDRPARDRRTNLRYIADQRREPHGLDIAGFSGTGGRQSGGASAMPAFFFRRVTCR